MKEETIDEKTAADKTELGFEYQHYFFLLKLLELKENQTIEWEVKDDVSLSLSNGEIYLFQLKHTIQKCKEGSVINLTTLDKDMWKTISNWSRKIADNAQGRGSEDKQKDFLKNVYFVLVSNKNKSDSNNVEVYIENRNYKTKKPLDLLEEMVEKTTDDEIKQYINNIKSLSNLVLEVFFDHISFELGTDEIITKCKSAIRECMVMEQKIDECFNNIDSSIRQNRYLEIGAGKKISITFNDFYKNYRRYFDIARSPELTMKEFNGAYPQKLEEQLFIRQLVDIEDIKETDAERIMDLTKFKMNLETTLQSWQEEGEITHDEVSDLRKEAINKWLNEYNHSFNNSKINDMKGSGREIIYNLRKEKLRIKNQELEGTYSNGMYYSLADEPIIGFMPDWRKKYVKK
jgi:hypothetical protein